MDLARQQPKPITLQQLVLRSASSVRVAGPYLSQAAHRVPQACYERQHTYVNCRAHSALEPKIIGILTN